MSHVTKIGAPTSERGCSGTGSLPRTRDHRFERFDEPQRTAISRGVFVTQNERVHQRIYNPLHPRDEAVARWEPSELSTSSLPECRKLAVVWPRAS